MKGWIERWRAYGAAMSWDSCRRSSVPRTHRLRNQWESRIRPWLTKASNSNMTSKTKSASGSQRTSIRRKCVTLQTLPHRERSTATLSGSQPAPLWRIRSSCRPLRNGRPRQDSFIVWADLTTRNVKLMTSSGRSPRARPASPRWPTRHVHPLDETITMIWWT